MPQTERPVASAGPKDVGLELVRMGPAAGERYLWRRVREHGDRRARELLIGEYLPLAHALARRQRVGDSREDLEQVAAVALIGAVDRFRPELGVPFAGYAAPCINGALLHHLRDNTAAIHLARASHERASAVGRVSARLTMANGRAATVEEIATASGLSAAQVIEGQGATRARVVESIERLVEREPEPGGLAACDPGFARAEARVTVAGLLPALPVGEREIVRLRYGEDLSQTRIAERLGMSQMHVSRRLRAALERLAAVAGGGPLRAHPR